ncbi:MAG TPA: hypothetical protein VGE38_01120 [Nocardioides sp.]|uniref:hypothetical protein n=1 Tax=Nocardioides sp. TaxID=35761 RepID=UPI002ED7DB78
MRSPDKATQGPDITNPEAWFADGDYCYKVYVLPVKFPMSHWMDEPSELMGALLGIVYGVVGMWIARLIDPHWKVVVCRLKPGRLGRWRTLSIEVFDSQEMADAERAAILESWELGRLANAMPLSRTQSKEALHRKSM